MGLGSIEDWAKQFRVDIDEIRTITGTSEKALYKFADKIRDTLTVRVAPVEKTLFPTQQEYEKFCGVYEYRHTKEVFKVNTQYVDINIINLRSGALDEYRKVETMPEQCLPKPQIFIEKQKYNVAFPTLHEFLG